MVKGQQVQVMVYHKLSMLKMCFVDGINTTESTETNRSLSVLLVVDDLFFGKLTSNMDICVSNGFVATSRDVIDT